MNEKERKLEEMTEEIVKVQNKYAAQMKAKTIILLCCLNEALYQIDEERIPSKESYYELDIKQLKNEIMSKFEKLCLYLDINQIKNSENQKPDIKEVDDMIKKFASMFG